MKRITSIFIVIATVLLLLCSCGKADNNTVSACTVFKEYDNDFSFDNFDSVVKMLDDLYDDSDYLVSGSEETGSIAVASRNKNKGEKLYGGFLIEIWDSKDEAHTLFEYESIELAQSCKLSVIRVNNALITGNTYIMIPFIKKMSLSVPSERKVPNSSVETIDKEIDIEKFFEKVSKSNSTKFYLEENRIYSIVDKTGTSILLTSFDNKSYIKDLYDINDFYKQTENIKGKYVEYNNCAFIFLDDFWLDMIKQCEK